MPSRGPSSVVILRLVMLVIRLLRGDHLRGRRSAAFEHSCAALMPVRPLVHFIVLRNGDLDVNSDRSYHDPSLRAA